MPKRIANRYNVNSETEITRIHKQGNITREGDIASISSLLRGQVDIDVLDVGCNNGELLSDRIAHIHGIKTMVGVDIDRKMVRNNELLNKDKRVTYLCKDCESDTFVEEMQKDTVGKFELIVISMILLHVKDPLKVLQNAKELLQEGGSIYIRDMDDGLSVAYPDPNNLVANMLDISNRVTETGYRKCGRQIYHLLKKAGFSDIEVANENIDTVGMSLEGRLNLFDTNFKYVKDDLDIAYKRDPRTYRDEQEWMNNNYFQLEKLFTQEDFYYRMGTISFLVRT